MDGAIHRAAGPGLAEACCKLGGCPTGRARITEGFDLPARWVIHAVGPVWSGGASDEARVLASCYRTALELAVEHRVRSMAFPAISCGVYGYPVEEAAGIAVSTANAFLQNASTLLRVVLCCFEDLVYKAYVDALGAV